MYIYIYIKWKTQRNLKNIGKKLGWRWTMILFFSLHHTFSWNQRGEKLG